MDNKLAYAALLVVLSWLSASTYVGASTTPMAMNTTMVPEGTMDPNATMVPDATMAPNATMVPEATMAPNATMVPEATMDPNATMVPDATMAPNATMVPDATMAPNATMVPEGTMAPNATMVPEGTMAPNATMVPEATMAPNATMVPEATMAPNATMVPDATMAPNATMVPEGTMAPNATMVPDATMAPTMTPAMTTAPGPLMQNLTVETLLTPISSQGCGTEVLCATEPADCDPANSMSCFQLGVRQQAGNNFDFQLAGESPGYIAATVSNDATVGNGDPTYVCANNNGTVQFFATVLTNEILEIRNLSVNSVKGRVNGTTIQCTFSATVTPAATRASGTTLAASSGTFNTTTGALGAPAPVLQTNPVDLTQPNATIMNEISNNSTNSTSSPDASASPATTCGGATLQQSLLQALLISVGVLSLAML